MAVYSPIKEIELVQLIKQYNIGALKKFEGILEGIENTNYKITTSKDIYILTLFEKRVLEEDLPFFFNLKNHLINKKFMCPEPIASKDGYFINKINNKSCVLISFIKGKQINNVLPQHCEQVGGILSTLHTFTLDFKEKRINRMDYTQWENLFIKCKSFNSSKHKSILDLVEKELLFLKNNWPDNLPRGIIHADVFKDNVFFINNVFSGLIDFYFSCYDFFAYDIALTINAWCFDEKINFDADKFKALIKGYELKRSIISNEKKSLNILLRGASLRILLTRIHDEIFHRHGAFVKPKDPWEYESILKYHQHNNLENYF